MDSVFTTLQAKIEGLLNTRQTVLCGGNAKDFAHYKQIVGEISGLNLAMNEINDLQKKRKDNDD